MASNEYNIDDKYTIVVEEQDTFQLELNKQGPQGERGPVGPVGPQGDKGEKGDQGIQGEVGPKGDTGVSVVGVEEISKVGLVATYRMTFSNGEYFDYEVSDGSIDNLTREQVISLIGYEPASYTSVEGLTTRVSTLEGRVEDLTASKFPNVVIVGSPHIEGGQVNGYSNTNYLQFPFVDISRGLPFDIYFSFTTGNDVTTQQNILDSYFGIALAIQNSKGVMALSSNGTSWDIGNVTGTNTILPNTTYYVKCGWTGTQYNASLSTDSTTYIPDMVLDSTLTTNKTTIFIGGSPDLFGAGTAHPFKGTINFNNSRVDVQGTTVWEGMADVGLASRANVSLNNLDEVGEKRFTDIQIALDGKQDKGTSCSGLEVGDIGMALYVDETKGLRRYLNGQIVDINTNTEAFFTRLQQITTLHPSLLCTEEEWQTAKTMSVFGQVGKFVFSYSGDEIVSVRIPAIVNVQGLFDLQNLGMTVDESLPNFEIVSKTSSAVQGGTAPAKTKLTTISQPYGIYTSATAYGETSPAGMIINGSALGQGTSFIPDSSTYQDNAPVQQEAIQYPYFIQIATGSETKNNIINEIELNNPFSLLDYKYSEYELNNLSWLRSNGQYNSKAVYPAVYDLLLKIYNGTETKAGVSVKLWTDTSATDYDFKINTAEETFMFPTKVNLASGKAVVGNGMTLGMTDGTINASPIFNTGTRLSVFTGSYGSSVGTTYAGSPPSTEKSVGITTDPTKSGMELSDSGLYLYFYVGETVQNANLIDAGRIGEVLANKQDKLSRYPIEISDKSLMPSWYVVYNDGWCEQGGYFNPTANGIYTINFLKSFKDTNYTISSSTNFGSNTNYTSTVNAVVGHIIANTQIHQKTTVGFSTGSYNYQEYNIGKYWEAKGYIN